MNNDLTLTRKSSSQNNRSYVASFKNITFAEARTYFSSVIGNIKNDLKLLKEQKLIWPAQCDGLICNLNNARSLVQSLCQMFDSSPYPVMMTTRGLGQEFIIKLYYIREQLDKLQEIVLAFRPLCRTSSKQAGKKRIEIFRKLELCILHCDDINRYMVSFQEKPQAATSFHSSVYLVRQEMKQQAQQPQECNEEVFERPAIGKRYPWYLVPVKDGYDEKRDTQKQWPVEEGQALQTEAEEQGPTNTSINSTRSFVSSTSACQCSAVSPFRLLSNLEVEQRSKDS